MNDEIHFAEAYAAVRRERWAVVSKICIGVAAPAVLAGVSLDYFVYPQYLKIFLCLRLLCVALILGMLPLYDTSFGRRFGRLLTFFWLTLIQMMVSYMIYFTEGANSPYYAGLNLAILGIGMVLPASVVDVLLLCAITVCIYVISCYYHGFGGVDSSLLYNNAYFIMVTSVIACMSVFISDLARQKEFRLTFELDKKNKELSDLDRLKSQFFANVSHELRTPLTLILAPVQDLLQGSRRLPDKIAGSLGIVRSNALRLLKLVNDLLDVIRLEEGKTTLERHPLRINSLVGGVVDAMCHLAEARDITLEKRIASEPWCVMGDQHAQEKVFFNLLSNALKFTPAGGSIVVSSFRDQDHVVVKVEDTGVGIGQKDLPYIFDRFRQVDSSATRRYPGTGLGLALVKELTEGQGGTVQLSSQVGAGTTVMIRLLLADERAPAQVSAPPTPDGGDSLEHIYLASEQVATLPLEPPAFEAMESNFDDRRPRVMVVDDEPDMRRYLTETLEDEYFIISAADGRRGLDLVRERAPDLMVLDLMLPELDGLEVCRRIKQDAATRATKVVLLTARADEAAKLTALEHGADDFLTKPFSSVELKTRLRNLLQAAMLERDLQSRNQTLEETLAELRRTEAQLVQSEKLNALGSLAAGLLHEINNPLNYAMTALQVAAAEPTIREDDDLREIFTDIDEGMQRIRNIVSDLRAFAYPSADDHRPFSFSEAVTSALQFTAHELRGVRIEQLLDESMPVVGSRNHIVQILVNLLSNAAKAVTRAEGERDAEIRITSHADGERLRVVVRDNGVGIEPDALSRIFDPFYTTRDVGEGMGLGLSICHTIAKNHGGVLTARSQVGEWTEFSFDLPLARGG